MCQDVNLLLHKLCLRVHLHKIFALVLGMVNAFFIYTVGHKKRATFIFFLITLANIDGFS